MHILTCIHRQLNSCSHIYISREVVFFLRVYLGKSLDIKVSTFICEIEGRLEGWILSVNKINICHKIMAVKNTVCFNRIYNVKLKLFI